MNTAYDREIHLNLLNLLQEKPKLTQREMNRKMGVSLGKINYCISALTKKGMYRLIPKGLEEVANLTISFLKIRIAEYDKIKKRLNHF